MTDITTTTMTTAQAMLVTELRQHPDVAEGIGAWQDDTLLEVIGRARTLKTALGKVAMALAAEGIDVAPAPDEEAPAPEAKPTRTRVVLDDTTPPKGYVLKYPHATFDTLKLVEKDLEISGKPAPAWYVACKVHGTMVAAANLKEVRTYEGAPATRAAWCKGCKADTK